jgi:hypothetical protein
MLYVKRIAAFAAERRRLHDELAAAEVARPCIAVGAL